MKAPSITAATTTEAGDFAPANLTETLTALSEAEDNTDDAALASAKEAIQSCGQRLQQYRAALEAGTDPVLVQQWTAEVQAERVQAEAKAESRSDASG
ncbi:hypothetical protein [Cryptosporangium phraense]|uniref:Uncharacterized protein n=1 Tax=Cryptosporangium phraense TaxID=2593070 RepID=A0A545AXX8_9ACTN|nr:hypothetical protein [Cryptosporangium phraense]TQS46189.1 hypothetical protein FL583_06855 [Cryptosporangium phraense]